MGPLIKCLVGLHIVQLIRHQRLDAATHADNLTRAFTALHTHTYTHTHTGVDKGACQT